MSNLVTLRFKRARLVTVTYLSCLERLTWISALLLCDIGIYLALVAAKEI